MDRFGSFSTQQSEMQTKKKALRKSILANKKIKQEKENEQNYYRFDTKALKSQRSRSTFYKMNQWNGAKNVWKNRRKKRIWLSFARSLISHLSYSSIL